MGEEMRVEETGATEGGPRQSLCFAVVLYMFGV